MARVDVKLEAVVIPVSDVDRARDFYSGLGWRLGDYPEQAKDWYVVFTRRG